MTDRRKAWIPIQVTFVCEDTMRTTKLLRAMQAATAAPTCLLGEGVLQFCMADLDRSNLIMTFGDRHCGDAPVAPRTTTPRQVVMSRISGSIASRRNEDLMPFLEQALEASASDGVPLINGSIVPRIESSKPWQYAIMAAFDAARPEPRRVASPPTALLRRLSVSSLAAAASALASPAGGGTLGSDQSVATRRLPPLGAESLFLKPVAGGGSVGVAQVRLPADETGRRETVAAMLRSDQHGWMGSAPVVVQHAASSPSAWQLRVEVIDGRVAYVVAMLDMDATEPGGVTVPHQPGHIANVRIPTNKCMCEQDPGGRLHIDILSTRQQLADHAAIRDICSGDASEAAVYASAIHEYAAQLAGHLGADVCAIELLYDEALQRWAVIDLNLASNYADWRERQCVCEDPRFVTAAQRVVSMIVKRAASAGMFDTDTRCGGGVPARTWDVARDRIRAAFGTEQKLFECLDYGAELCTPVDGLWRLLAEGGVAVRVTPDPTVLPRVRAVVTSLRCAWGVEIDAVTSKIVLIERCDG